MSCYFYRLPSSRTVSSMYVQAAAAPIISVSIIEMIINRNNYKYQQ